MRLNELIIPDWNMRQPHAAEVALSSTAGESLVLLSMGWAASGGNAVAYILNA